MLNYLNADWIKPISNTFKKKRFVNTKLKLNVMYTILCLANTCILKQCTVKKKKKILLKDCHFSCKKLVELVEENEEKFKIWLHNFDIAWNTCKLT